MPFLCTEVAKGNQAVYRFYTWSIGRDVDILGHALQSGLQCCVSQGFACQGSLSFRGHDGLGSHASICNVGLRDDPAICADRCGYCLSLPSSENCHLLTCQSQDPCCSFPEPRYRTNKVLNILHEIQQTTTNKQRQRQCHCSRSRQTWAPVQASSR